MDFEETGVIDSNNNPLKTKSKSLCVRIRFVTIVYFYNIPKIWLKIVWKKNLFIFFMFAFFFQFSIFVYDLVWMEFFLLFIYSPWSLSDILIHLNLYLKKSNVLIAVFDSCNWTSLGRKISSLDFEIFQYLIYPQEDCRSSLKHRYYVLSLISYVPVYINILIYLYH